MLSKNSVKLMLLSFLTTTISCALNVQTREAVHMRSKNIRGTPLNDRSSWDLDKLNRVLSLSLSQLKEPNLNVAEAMMKNIKLITLTASSCLMDPTTTQRIVQGDANPF